jgi:hypothetical protein
MRALLALLLVPLLSCGGGTFFVGVNTNTGSTVAVGGMVSFVQLTVVNGNVNVTIVTLVTNGSTNSITFCGSNASQFPINSFMQVNFTPAQPCVSAFRIQGFSH